VNLPRSGRRGGRGAGGAKGSLADRLLDADILWSLAFVSVVFVLVQTGECVSVRPQWVPGGVADDDIVVERETEIPDRVLTEERRNAARAAVPDLYTFDSDRAASLAEFLRAELDARPDLPADRAEQVVGAFREVMASPVVANKAVLDRSGRVRIRRVPGGREEVTSDFGGVLGLAQAQRRVFDRVVGVLGDLPPDTSRAAARAAADLVDVTLTFDPGGTEARRAAAAADVPPVRVKVPGGTLLVRKGDRITPEVRERLESALAYGREPRGWVPAVALLVLVVLFSVFLHRYAVFHQRRFHRVRHLHALLTGTVLLTLLVARATLWVAGEVAQRFPGPFGDVSSYGYLAPVGAGAILVALLANGRIAMVFSVFVAVLFGGMQGWDAHQSLWALLVQWTAIYAITTYRERSALLRAGLFVGVVGAVVALAVEALRLPEPDGARALYGAVLAFVSGAVGIGLLVSFVLPPFETLFRVLTDVRLLELSNVNNPLLSELALKAPGTYNHSMTVGTLAEEAAKAIGANSLFCRVAAAYHDVGKMGKPEYFVENQRGSNPHDRLAPSMSALIIASHVKEGIRLARQARIPEQIVDIIPQHHGTRLMTYFFEKARRQTGAAGREPNQADFRYPGPKPRTREAAIFMLADGIEAAARTVDDPTPNRLREVIRKVANAIVLDGQFEECDLTFADLEKIESALLRALTSMYHHRVEYPGFDFGRPRGDGRAGRGTG
jgi:putative nucleotidyltransferase with HDIG domain